MNERIVVCVHLRCEHAAFLFEFEDFFFPLFDLMINGRAFFACRAGTPFHESAAAWSVPPPPQWLHSHTILVAQLFCN